MEIDSHVTRRLGPRIRSISFFEKDFSHTRPRREEYHITKLDKGLTLGWAAVWQRRGGGVTFGPVVRSHAHDLPRKVRRLGLKCALSVSYHVLRAKKEEEDYPVLPSEGDCMVVRQWTQHSRYGNGLVSVTPSSQNKNTTDPRCWDVRGFLLACGVAYSDCLRLGTKSHHKARLISVRVGASRLHGACSCLFGKVAFTPCFNWSKSGRHVMRIW